MRTRLLFVYAEEHTNSLYAQAIDKAQEWCAFSILMDSSSLQDIKYDEIPEEFNDFIEWVKRGSEG
jgi:hypothetical protein